MEVSVRMTAEEFREFMDWKKERSLYEMRETNLRRDMGGKLEAIAAAVLGAVAPIDNNPEEFKIAEQGHMSDAWDLAGDVFA